MDKNRILSRKSSGLEGWARRCTGCTAACTEGQQRQVCKAGGSEEWQVVLSKLLAATRWEGLEGREWDAHAAQCCCRDGMTRTGEGWVAPSAAVVLLGRSRSSIPSHQVGWAEQAIAELRSGKAVWWTPTAMRTSPLGR
eukprot:EG_transcript_14752